LAAFPNEAYIPQAIHIQIDAFTLSSSLPWKHES